MRVVATTVTNQNKTTGRRGSTSGQEAAAKSTWGPTGSCRVGAAGGSRKNRGGRVRTAVTQRYRCVGVATRNDGMYVNVCKTAGSGSSGCMYRTVHRRGTVQYTHPRYHTQIRNQLHSRTFGGLRRNQFLFPTAVGSCHAKREVSRFDANRTALQWKDGCESRSQSPLSIWTGTDALYWRRTANEGSDGGACLHTPAPAQPHPGAPYRLHVCRHPWRRSHPAVDPPTASLRSFSCLIPCRGGRGDGGLPQVGSAFRWHVGVCPPCWSRRGGPACGHPLLCVPVGGRPVPWPWWRSLCRRCHHLRSPPPLPSAPTARVVCGDARGGRRGAATPPAGLPRGGQHAEPPAGARPHCRRVGG